jgi:hypothetical protein
MNGYLPNVHQRHCSCTGYALFQKVLWALRSLCLGKLQPFKYGWHVGVLSRPATVDKVNNHQMKAGGIKTGGLNRQLKENTAESRWF